MGPVTLTGKRAGPRTARAVVVFLLLMASVSGCGSPDVAAFVQLGGLSGKSPAPVELTGDAGEVLYRELRERGQKDNEQARAALTAPRGGGDVRTFAFIKAGCVETGAEPVVKGDVLAVKLTGGENTNCAAANYFLVIVSVKDAERRLRPAS
ncbi:hypothetical protein ACIQUM_31965 [Amycolatopsis azurea]|uniref:hypothetical protein n=1 Tax=Amycolatopsis azurea TaxID=36819 RepID=UPI00382556B4